MIKKILCFVGVVAALLSLVLVPVSAAEFSVDNTVVPYDPILDQYPSSNMLPFPYRFRDSTVVSGITITSDSDYYLTFDGIASATSYNVISKMNLPVGDYILSDVPLGTSSDIWTTVRTPQGNYYRSGNGITFSVQNESDLIEVLVSVANGYVVDNVSFRPMLSKGTVSYAWSPYLPYVFNQYSNSGYNNGYNNGYDNGYTQGRDDLADEAAQSQLNAFNPLSGLTCSVYSEQEDNTLNFEYTGVPVEVNALGAIRFDRIYSYVLNKFASETSNAEFRPLNIRISFEWPRDNNLPLQERLTPIFQDYVQINTEGTVSDLFITLVLDADNQSYQQVNLVPQQISGTGYYYDTVQYKDQHFVGLSVYFELPSNGSVNYFDFLNYTVMLTDAFAPNTNYVYGYIDGADYAGQFYYDIGFEDGYLEGDELGRAEGLEEGYRNGYQQGRNDSFDVADNGSLTKLLAASVEAPVNAVMGMLDFELLGVNLKVAFGTILSLCLILIVIKKVVF